ncbi:2-C-methyl-D-erythritol 4-phosphate cytidylyltransferase [Pyrococcus kukulkanii]|uniref:IspD/TarI family cytidylyltransferase n=1 Tax=Pyrococcus kukulkanii TaxID=1609559 RepID=UPI003568126F
MTALILLAGGYGRRTSLDVPKQFVKINGRTILEHTLGKVSGVEGIDEIIVVSNPEFLSLTKSITRRFPKVMAVTAGGVTRNESIYKGFLKVPEDEENVIIHDAVRPFTPRWIFARIIKLLDEKDVVTTVNPITGNLIELDGEFVGTIHDRKRFAIGEAPTGYRYEVLKRTLEHALERGILNVVPHDVELAMKAGFRVHALFCNCFNLKITFKEDIEIARALLGGKDEADGFRHYSDL